MHTIGLDHSALTERQQQVLEYVRSYTKAQGYPPCVREIGEGVGLSSSSTVHGHLSRLVDKGFLKREEARPRTLAIVGNNTKVVAVPLIGEVAAGTPQLSDEHIESFLSVREDFVGRTPDVFSLRVKGESMTGAGIHDGDYLFVRKQDTADHGDIVVALVPGADGDGATVKRLHCERDRVLLVPANPDYSPIDARDCRIVGVVVSLMRFDAAM